MNKDYIKAYIKTVYRILGILGLLIGILIFITGKASFSENATLIKSYFTDNSNTSTAIAKHIEPPYNFVESSDNLVTTILKTLLVILALLAFFIALIISSILEFFIWVFSWGDNTFFCTKQLWNLLWSKIVYHWYWIPSQSLYLWITFLLYGGFFSNESRDAQHKATLRFKVKSYQKFKNKNKGIK